jgi:hypothetical protein
VASDGYKVLQSLIERQALLDNDKLLTTGEEMMRGKVLAYCQVYDMAEVLIQTVEAAEKNARLRQQLEHEHPDPGAARFWGSPNFYAYRKP